MALPRFALILLVLALLPVDPCLAQAGSAQVAKKCFKCQGTSWLPCTNKDHEQKRVCGITNPHKCDTIYRTPCCLGIGKTPCLTCRDPSIEAEFENEKAMRISWLESTSMLENEMKLGFVHIETDNYILRSNLPSWKIKDITYSRTKAAHLFAQRLEAVASRFKTVTGVLPSTKQLFWIGSSEKDNFRITILKFGGGQNNMYRQNGPQCQICTWPNPNPPRMLGSDEQFHSHVIHAGTHELTQSAVAFHLNFQSWFDEAMSHWMERDFLGTSRNFCFHEVQAKDPWEVADWSKRIFGEVAAKSEPQFAAITGLGLDHMKYRDVAYAWGFVDYMIKAEPEKFKVFFAAIKKHNDTKKALEEAFQQSTAAFQDSWRAWVLKNYGGK